MDAVSSFFLFCSCNLISIRIFTNIYLFVFVSKWVFLCTYGCTSDRTWYGEPNFMLWSVMLNCWAMFYCLFAFFFLSNLFFFSSNFLDYAYGIYVLSDFCFARICKWGISWKCYLCDDFSVLTFVVYVSFSRYIHLAWIRLHQDGFILRMDCFYFYIRFDSNSHGWCCQYFF